MPDVYERAVKTMCPDLYYAIQLTERVKSSDVFPIASIQNLIDTLLADDIHKKATANLKIEGRTLSIEDASKLFPLRFLPIKNHDDLLEKIYASFVGYRHLRSLEAKVRAYRQSITKERGGRRG